VPAPLAALLRDLERDGTLGAQLCVSHVAVVRLEPGGAAARELRAAAPQFARREEEEGETAQWPGADGAEGSFHFSAVVRLRKRRTYHDCLCGDWL
jgi:hypothetical protein